MPVGALPASRQPRYRYRKRVVRSGTEALSKAGPGEYSVADMTRSTRLAVLGGTLLVLVAGTALGTQALHPGRQGPLTASQEEEPDAPPTAEDLAHAADRL